MAAGVWAGAVSWKMKNTTEKRAPGCLIRCIRDGFWNLFFRRMTFSLHGLTNDHCECEGHPPPAPRPSPVQLTQICEDILSATSTVFGKIAELDCLSAYNPDRKQSSWWCHQVVFFSYFMDICSNLDVFCWRFCSLRIRQICEQLLFAQSDATAKIL